MARVLSTNNGERDLLAAFPRTSQVFWRSGAMPTSFAIMPAPTASSGFAMTAASGYPAVAGAFKAYLQWKEEGVNLGLPDVRVVNVTGNPAICKATRGVGENSNVITIRLNPTLSVPGWNTLTATPSQEPPLEPPVMDWLFTNNDFTGELFA